MEQISSDLVAGVQLLDQGIILSDDIGSWVLAGYDIDSIKVDLYKLFDKKKILEIFKTKYPSAQFN